VQSRSGECDFVTADRSAPRWTARGCRFVACSISTPILLDLSGGVAFQMAPGVWIDARDRSVDGIGNMFVRLESTITVANSSGPELDQGALLRLLGELAWLPTAFLDDRHVAWSAIDDRHARATLRVNDRVASGEFEFGADGLPTTFAAERYRDIGAGKSVLTPFVGRFSDFRSVDNVLVPHRAVGAWIVDGKTLEYANFEVRQLEFDRAEPW
jgi:uncharacterized protein DUF6920